MKDNEFNNQDKGTTKLWQRVVLTSVAAFLTLIIEQLMWLGIGYIRTDYLRLGDELDTLLLSFCILFAAFFLAAIICACLYYAFRDTRVGNLFKIKVLRKTYKDNN